jgi:alanine racemase
MSRPTRVEIYLDAIAHNIREVRKIVGGRTKIMAVVKDDGYGHGAIEVARVAQQQGVEYLAVAIPEEGVELRQAGISLPILVLSQILPQNARIICKYDLSQTVCTVELARALSAEAQKFGKMTNVHIKVDTGMRRIGVLPEEVVSFIREISKLGGISIEGIFTHLSEAGGKSRVFTDLQITKFNKVIIDLEQSGIRIPCRHVANSAGILNFPSSYFDLVRPGIMLYGLYPSKEISILANLKPAMSFKTAIVYLKTVPSGTSIGYDRTFTTHRESIIATLPVGYGDGYSYLLSNKGEVLVRGKRAPIVGKVCMDMTMIDVSNIPGVQIGDEAVLFGRKGCEKLPVDEVAFNTDVINYVVVCNISKRVPRIYMALSSF